MTLSEQSLEELASSTNILIEATNNITIGNLNDNTLTFRNNAGANTGGGGGSISFKAINGDFSMKTTDTILARGRDVNITAGKNVSIGNINTSLSTNGSINAGKVSITAISGNINATSINSQAFSYFGKIGNGGDITVTAPSGNINVTNGIFSGTTIEGSGDTVGNGGNITLDAASGIITTPVLNTTSVRNNPGNPGRGGNININGKVDLSQSTIFDSFGILGGGNINLNGTVNGSSDLTISTGSGNVNFTSSVGNTITLGALVINSSGRTVFNSTVNATRYLHNIIL
jgi:hypothetical protein